MKTMVIMNGRTWMVDENTANTMLAILGAMGEEVGKTETTTTTETATATEETKDTKKKSTKGKKNTKAKVVYTDKYGRQWLVDFRKGSGKTFPTDEYQAKSEEMYGKSKPGKANREAVYRALGWIL